MNTLTMLRDAHRGLTDAFAQVPDTLWNTPDMIGRWSIREVAAQLAAFEQVLVDVLQSKVNGSAALELERLLADRIWFNIDAVVQRQNASTDDILVEYYAAYAQSIQLLNLISPEERQRPGAIPWYGAEFSLDDFIAFTFYVNKRNFAAQIASAHADPIAA